MPAVSFPNFLLRAVTLGVVAGIAAFLLADALDGKAGNRSSYREAVRQAAPAVVNVYSARRVPAEPRPDRPLFDEFFGSNDARTRLQTTLGSGVIIDTAGHVVTNHHVVAGAERIEIAVADGRRLSARRVGSDPDTDLALLRIDAGGLQPIEPADGGSPEVGDVVLALGNPYGVGRAVTLGIVSATGRDRLGLSTFEDFIQHDAAINPGNSGGALINPQGELVGINTAIFSRSGGSHGIGFAIPVDMMLEVVGQLARHGRVIRGWLGVRTEDLPPSVAAGDAPGLRVTGVFAEGPAARAGLRRGDILVAIGDTNLVDVETLLRATTGNAPGSEVEVVYRRDGERRRATAILGQRPSPP